MRCKGKGEAKLCVGKPQKLCPVDLSRIIHHIISYHNLFASLCVVWHIRVVLLVLLYVVIPVVLLLFYIEPAQ